MPELKVPEGDQLPTACLTCALYGGNPGFESVRRVTLGFGVTPPKICTTSIRHLPTRIFFHHQGWLQLQCPLDVGCGGGRLLSRMKKCGWQVEGIDFDEQATKKVTARYGIKTHVGDITQCNLVENSFDAICMSQTIEHLYDPISALRECLRILKPGGILVMTTPNANSIGSMEFGPSWRGWEPPRHLHLFSVQSLRQLTSQVGFNIIEGRTYSAGSAVVYRVSKKLQSNKQSWIQEFRLLLWGYRKELQEFRAQKNKPCLSG